MASKRAQPLKLRMLIRDEWAPKDSRVNKPRTQLEDELGVPVNLEVNWNQILEEIEADAVMDPPLKRFLSDPTDIFNNTVDFVCEFMRLVYQRLHDDEDWGMVLLDRIDNRSLNINLASQRNKTSIHWDPDHRGTVEFRLEQRTYTWRGEAVGVAHDVAKDLNDGSASKATARSHGKSKEYTPPPPLPTRLYAPDPTGYTTQQESPPKQDHMPALRELSDPKDLFTSCVPYIMYVTIFRSHVSANPGPYGQSVRLMGGDEYHSNVEINCSHEPSLLLMKDYFSQFSRHDSNVRGPVVKVDLQEGYLVNGVQDTLFLKPYDSKATSVHIGPAFILSFIQGVLGYSHVGTVSNSLIYRRDRAFV